MSRKANLASHKYISDCALIAKERRNAQQRKRAQEKKDNAERTRAMLEGTAPARLVL